MTNFVLFHLCEQWSALMRVQVLIWEVFTFWFFHSADLLLLTPKRDHTSNTPSCIYCEESLCGTYCGLTPTTFYQTKTKCFWLVMTEATSCSLLGFSNGYEPTNATNALETIVLPPHPSAAITQSWTSSFWDGPARRCKRTRLRMSTKQTPCWTTCSPDGCTSTCTRPRPDVTMITSCHGSGRRRRRCE